MFLTRDETKKIGFMKLGTNVEISSLAKFYKPELMEIGNNIRIDDNCIFSGKIVLKDSNHISVFCYLDAGIEPIILEKYAGLSHRCTVFTRTDDYSGQYMAGPLVPKICTKITSKPVHLKKHTIVGASSVVLPGVTLEEGSIIGAMSLVTKSTKPWKKYFGIPAKIIGNRKKDLLELEKKHILEQLNNEA